MSSLVLFNKNDNSLVVTFERTWGRRFPVRIRCLPSCGWTTSTTRVLCSSGESGSAEHRHTLSGRSHRVHIGRPIAVIMNTTRIWSLPLGFAPPLGKVKKDWGGPVGRLSLISLLCAVYVHQTNVRLSCIPTLIYTGLHSSLCARPSLFSRFQASIFLLSLY